MMQLILTMLTISQVWGSDSEFKTLKAQFEKAVSCRVQPGTADASQLGRSVTCYHEVFSAKMNTQEQAGMSLWFNNLKSVKKIWACDGKEYQLKSYPKYTPYFICVNLSEAEYGEGTKLIFFKKEKSGFKISTIYSPVKW